MKRPNPTTNRHDITQQIKDGIAALVAMLGDTESKYPELSHAVHACDDDLMTLSYHLGYLLTKITTIEATERPPTP